MNEFYASITNNAISICFLIVGLFVMKAKYPLGNEKISSIPVKYIKIGGYIAIGIFTLNILITIINQKPAF
jgi:hypothetical protein